MAAVKQYKPLPLLRRPLPPKSAPLPPINHASTVATAYESHVENSWSDSTTTHSKTRFVGSPEPNFQNFSKWKGEQILQGQTTLVHEAYCRRGPDPLPTRPPRKPRELPPEAFVKDSFEKPPPEFTLRDFLRRHPTGSASARTSRTRKKEAFQMVSGQNFEKYENFMSWYDTDRAQQAEVHSFDIDRKVNVPDVTPRKPTRQLLIEMKVPAAGEDGLYSPEGSPQPVVTASGSIKMMPVTPAVSKATIPKSRSGPLPLESREKTGQKLDDWEFADEKFESMPDQDGAEIMRIEQKGQKELEEYVKNKDKMSKDSNVKTFAQPTKATVVYEIEGPSLRKQPQAVLKQATDSARLKFDAHAEVHQYPPEVELGIAIPHNVYHDRPKVTTYPETEMMLPNSSPAYFQGEAPPRTSSPFVSPENSQMSPLEAVILNAMITSSTSLNLKAHFISRLPRLSPLAATLTHLNASFNDFWVFPPEILELKKLVSLKLRDNPIKEIPQEIKKLKHLKLLDMSFNLLSSLPASLFEFKELESLDLGYNRLSFLPSEISKLKLLSTLVLEGNQLGALPVNALRLQLRVLKIGNNFIHPLFWRETANNQPQRLVDVCALTVANCGIKWTEKNKSEPIQRILENPGTCDCCGSLLFGQGLRVIKAMGEVFGVKNLPFLFKACSQTCRKAFVRNPEAVQQWLLRNNIAGHFAQVKRVNESKAVKNELRT